MAFPFSYSPNGWVSYWQWWRHIDTSWCWNLPVRSTWDGHWSLRLLPSWLSPLKLRRISSRRGQSVAGFYQRSITRLSFNNFRNCSFASVTNKTLRSRSYIRDEKDFFSYSLNRITISFIKTRVFKDLLRKEGKSRSNNLMNVIVEINVEVHWLIYWIVSVFLDAIASLEWGNGELVSEWVSLHKAF